MQFSHNYLSAIEKYILIQAALVGVFTGFVFGLVGEASRFAAADSIFSILALLIGIGYIGFLVFPLISSGYLIKHYRGKWAGYSIFGIMGIIASITSIYLLLQYNNYFFDPPPVHVFVAFAVSIPATGFALTSPIIYFLGRLREFTQVNFHLFLVLVMLLTAVPSGFTAASLSDVLVDEGRHQGQCKAILKTQCSVEESMVSVPNICQRAFPEARDDLKAEGYAINETEDEIFIECPDS